MLVIATNKLIVLSLLHVYKNGQKHNQFIIESIDSISRDGPDTPIYIIHYKKRNNSEQVKL